jgi:mannitol-specific phosphotransferase system IIBC component
MVRAAMLFSAPANPLSLTATAMSASEGATVGAGIPASWRLASIAFLTSSRKAEERSSTIWAIAKENQKKETKLKRKEKMSKPKKNAKKRNRNQGKIQRYIYRKQHKEKEFKKKNEKKNANW